MKKFGISVLCALVAVVSVLFAYYMTRATYTSAPISTETVYEMAKNAGYTGTLVDFINDFKGAVGDDGRGIASAEIKADGHLIITYTDMTSVDAGTVNADSISITDGVSGEAINRLLSSSVSIFSSKADGTYLCGSGIIYKLDKAAGTAYIITNYHVLYDAESKTRVADSNINVYLYGMEYPMYSMNVEYVGGTVDYDLAVLKIKSSEILKSSSATSATLGNSELVSVLDTVVSVGNSGGAGLAVTLGTVNVESENKYINTGVAEGSVFMRVIRFDAAVNEGDSGGGLYNDCGELIGITTAKDKNAGADNLAYAIPINVAKEVADNILYYCDEKEAEHGKIVRLGITLDVKSATVIYDAATDRTVKYEKIVIKEISEGSYAAYAGLLPGDVLISVAVDGYTAEIIRMYHAPEMTLRVREGSNIIYKVLRGTEEYSFVISVPRSLEDIK